MCWSNSAAMTSRMVAEAVFSDLPRFDAILDSDTLFTDGRH